MSQVTQQMRKYVGPVLIGLVVGLAIGYLDPFGVSDPSSELRQKMPDWLVSMFDQPWQVGLLGAALALVFCFIAHQFKSRQAAAAYSMPGSRVASGQYDEILPSSYYGSAPASGSGNAQYNPVGFDNRVPM